MVRLALNGDYNNALTIHHRFTELIELLFVDGNPAGQKYSQCDGIYRK